MQEMAQRLKKSSSLYESELSPKLIHSFSLSLRSGRFSLCKILFDTPKQPLGDFSEPCVCFLSLLFRA